MNEQHTTLLQTIQARLEWNKKGNVIWIQDDEGPWKIIPLTNSTVVSYFTSAYQEGIDSYGQIKGQP